MTYDFQAVKARIGIETLFREDGHELKRMGAKLRCLSPFNAEKTPSCYVDPARGRFKCFSSGNSGDVFDYVMMSRGCGIEQAMTFLADKAGIDMNSRGAMPAPLLPRAKVEEKPFEPICGEELATWREGVLHLEASWRVCEAIAGWRGYSTRTVVELASQGKIGNVWLNAWLRKQDQEMGERRIAFPVEDASGKLLAYHVRLKPRAGEKRASWRFVPTGCGAWPYVFGDARAAKFLIVCEGQWDAIALFDALGISYADLLTEGVAIAGMRGATNWRLFVEHYLLETNRRGTKCMVVCDGDMAGEGWSAPDGDEPSFVQVLQAIFGKVFVREPLEALGKDVNDVWKALNAQEVAA